MNNLLNKIDCLWKQEQNWWGLKRFECLLVWDAPSHLLKLHELEIRSLTQRLLSQKQPSANDVVKCMSVQKLQSVQRSQQSGKWLDQSKEHSHKQRWLDRYRLKENNQIHHKNNLKQWHQFGARLKKTKKKWIKNKNRKIHNASNDQNSSTNALKENQT